MSWQSVQFRPRTGINQTRLCAAHTIQEKEMRREVNKEKTKAIPNRKKYSPKRWVVERTNSWYNRFRKLFTRYEKEGRVLSFIGTILL